MKKSIIVIFITLIIFSCSWFSLEHSNPIDPLYTDTDILTPLNVTVIPSSAQVSISWTPVTDASNYKVFYKEGTTVSSTDSSATALTTELTSLLITNLTNNSTYAFIVISVTVYGESQPSVVRTATPSENFTYAIGSTGPAGGIVFYDQGAEINGWRYLECATSDQSTGLQWYNGTFTNIEAAIGVVIGSGKSNTAAIISAQGAGDYAAMLCDILILGGFNDWFLPSKNELNWMYRNLVEINHLGDFSGEWYWSSSQYNYERAWDQSFSDGVQNGSFKDDAGRGQPSRIRAIRAF